MLFYPIRINIQSARCVNYSIFQDHLYITLKINLQKKYNAEEKLTQHIKEIFKNSRNNYGSRKIKVELKKKGIIASKRWIRLSWRKMALYQRTQSNNIKCINRYAITIK